MQPEGMGTAVPPDRQAAKSALMAPAIILAIVAVLGIVGAIAMLALPQMAMELLAQVQQGNTDLQGDELQKAQEALQASRGPNLAMYGAMLVLSVAVLFGSVQMLRMRSYGLAMAAAIMSIIPCIGPCYCPAIPFGIWALVVLMRPQVKAAFQ